ncbi:hypothetical protein RDI58_000797 [Solanum bulbocastanum]|uniref:Uncharacterized protein n=1 Tax=Solanum bulbocastanum TaxID=147425 RepID=A0AAN8U867_SOLBU
MDTISADSLHQLIMKLKKLFMKQVLQLYSNLKTSFKAIVLEK